VPGERRRGGGQNRELPDIFLEIFASILAASAIIIFAALGVNLLSGRDPLPILGALGSIVGGLAATVVTFLLVRLERERDARDVPVFELTSVIFTHHGETQRFLEFTLMNRGSRPSGIVRFILESADPSETWIESPSVHVERRGDPNNGDPLPEMIYPGQVLRCFAILDRRSAMDRDEGCVLEVQPVLGTPARATSNMSLARLAAEALGDA